MTTPQTPSTSAAPGSGPDLTVGRAWISELCAALDAASQEGKALEIGWAMSPLWTQVTRALSPGISGTLRARGASDKDVRSVLQDKLSSSIGASIHWDGSSDPARFTTRAHELWVLALLWTGYWQLRLNHQVTERLRLLSGEARQEDQLLRDLNTQISSLATHAARLARSDQKTGNLPGGGRLRELIFAWAAWQLGPAARAGLGELLSGLNKLSPGEDALLKSIGVKNRPPTISEPLTLDQRLKIEDAADVCAKLWDDATRAETLGLTPPDEAALRSPKLRRANHLLRRAMTEELLTNDTGRPSWSEALPRSFLTAMNLIGARVSLLPDCAPECSEDLLRSAIRARSLAALRPEDRGAYKRAGPALLVQLVPGGPWFAPRAGLIDQTVGATLRIRSTAQSRAYAQAALQGALQRRGQWTPPAPTEPNTDIGGAR